MYYTNATPLSAYLILLYLLKGSCGIVYNSTTSSWIKSVAEREIMSLQILDIMVTTQLDLNYNALWEAVYNVRQILCI